MAIQKYCCQFGTHHFSLIFHEKISFIGQRKSSKMQKKKEMFRWEWKKSICSGNRRVPESSINAIFILVTFMDCITKCKVR